MGNGSLGLWVGCSMSRVFYEKGCLWVGVFKGRGILGLGILVHSPKYP